MSESIPQITISVPGRWHAFDLAKGLEAAGALHRLITIYPKSFTRKWDIPDSKVRTLPFLIYIQRVAQRYLPNRLSKYVNVLVLRFFSYFAACVMGTPEVVHAWSGSSSSIFKKAKSRGILCILERSSSHIREQYSILSQEASILGIPFDADWTEAFKAEEDGYRDAARIFVPSLFVYSSMIKRGILEDKLFLNGFGADLSVFKPAHDCQHKGLRVICAGSKSYRKGLRYLIQAFKDAQIEGSTLTLVGGGCEQIEHLIVDAESIKNHPRVPQNQLVDFYQGSDLFVHPSIEEGQSMVQLQALACGLPLVCTRNTGGEDLLRALSKKPLRLDKNIEQYPAGFVVDAKDADALAYCMKHLDEQPELLASMKEAARRMRDRPFSWMDYALRNLAEYERLLAKRSKEG